MAKNDVEADLGWGELINCEERAVRKLAIARGAAFDNALRPQPEPQLRGAHDSFRSDAPPSPALARSSGAARRLETGDRVHMTGMGRRGELNGRSGTVVESVPDLHGRVCVRLDGEEKVMRILVSRLVPENGAKSSVLSVRLPPGVRDSSKLGFHGFGVCHPLRSKSTGELVPSRNLHRAFVRRKDGGFYSEVDKL